ncbi:hypothetical protein [Actinomadura sp. 9N407]|uniref:hypothetical protein n=1 Tax=Actinomadura sp. 9N407 TaxID=3375154 RepID=UPI0037B5F93F
MDLSSAAHDLYGVAPDDFMDTRKRLVQEAKTAGDAALAKKIGALRRPTLPAWAVNLLSRSAGEELGWLLDVGTQMREAWSSGGSIGGLEQRRGELVALLVRRARELAEEGGHPLRDPAVREVEDTLQAATVDADVADEVRQGRLTQPRSHTGFVPAGFPAPQASPAPRQKKAKAETRQGAGQKAEQGVRRERATEQEQEAEAEAEAEKQEAQQEAQQKAEPERQERPRRSAAAVERARKKAEEADRELAEREAEVYDAQEERKSADAEAGRLRRELDKAIRRQETAERHLEKVEHRRDQAAEAAAKARRKVQDE